MIKSSTKIVLGSIAAFVALAVLLGIAGFALGWFNKGTKVVSASNVEKQYGVVIGKYNDMIAGAQNVCTVQKAGEKPKTEQSPTLVESPTLAYEATFRKLVADYNKTVDNPFEGQIVVPPGYPTSSQLNNLDTKNWCTVSDQLKALKS